MSRTYEILPSLAPTPISFLHPFVNSIVFHPFQLSLCPSPSCTDLDFILRCSLFNLHNHLLAHPFLVFLKLLAFFLGIYKWLLVFPEPTTLRKG